MQLPTTGSLSNLAKAASGYSSHSLVMADEDPTTSTLNTAAAQPPSTQANALTISSDANNSTAGNASSPTVAPPAPGSSSPSQMAFYAKPENALVGTTTHVQDESTLAPTTFSAGPNDNLASVDVYNLPNSTTPVNSIQAVSKAPAAPALSAFKGSEAGIAKLKGLMNTISTDINAINNFSLPSYLGSIIPGLPAILNATKANCGPANKFTNGLASDLAGLNNMIATVNGTAAKLRPAQLGCAVNIGNIINTMSKANGCMSLQFTLPEFNIKLFSLKNLLLAALEAGLLGIFGALICGIKDLLMIDALASSTANACAVAGDTSSLQLISNVCTPGLLSVSVPTLHATIISNISNKVNNSSGIANVRSISNTLTTLNTLNPKWMSTSTPANGNISDLTTAIKGNRDFHSGVKSIFSKAIPITPASIKGNIAGCVKKNDIANFDLLYAPSLAGGITSVSGAISNSFPNTVVSINSNTINAGIVIPSNNVISPLLLAA